MTGILVENSGGGAAWISGTTNPYVTSPKVGDGQLHLFHPNGGETYQLNVFFPDEADGGHILSLQMDCGSAEEIDFAPVSVPETEATPTPVADGFELPYLRLLQDANCRANPGSGFEAVDVLPAGFMASIIATVPDQDWLQIHLENFNLDCWLAQSVVDFTGTLEGLPVLPYPTQPTPTTDPDESSDVLPQCSDGADNDSDGYVDDIDRECDDADDNDESS
jgi:hypothetical protein